MATDQKIVSVRASVAIEWIDGTENGNADARVYLASSWPNNNLKAGQTIVISGTSDFNGTFEIKSVASQSEFVIVHSENNQEATTDGTAGGDYSSLEDAESNERANLVTSDQDIIFEIYNDWQDGLTETTQIRFDTANWTTDRDHWIIIRSPATDVGRPWIEHDGPTLRMNGVTFPIGGEEHGFLHFDDDLDFFLQDFEIDGDEDAGHTGHTNPYAGVTFRGGVGGGSFLMENMRIHDFQGGGSQNDCVRMMCTGFDTLFQWRNVVLYNTNDEGVQMDADGGSGSTVDDWHPESYWDHGVIFDAGDIGIAVVLDNSNVKIRNIYSSCPVDLDFENRGTVRIHTGVGCASEDSTATDLSGGSGNPTLVVAEEVLNDPAIGDMRPIHRTDGNQLSKAGVDFDLGNTDFPGILGVLGHGEGIDIDGDSWGTDRDIGVFSYNPSGPNPTSASTSISSSNSTTRSTSASNTASSASSSRTTTRSSSNSTTRSTSVSTTVTDPPFFQDTDRAYSLIGTGDLTQGTGTTFDECSSMDYFPPADTIIAVDDGRFMWEFDRITFDAIQVSPITLPGGSGDGQIDDPEGVTYIGDYFTDWDVAIVDEGGGSGDAATARMHLFPYTSGQTTLSSGDITTFLLPKITHYAGKPSPTDNAGVEGIAFDPNTGKFYLSHQSKDEAESGIWEVDIENLDTDGNPTHSLLYRYEDAGIIGTDGFTEVVDIGKDLAHGSRLSPSAFGSLTFERSLFMLVRNTIDRNRKVIQFDTKSGAVISEFTHSLAGQIEGLFFDPFPTRGDMFIAGEEVDVGTPNIWRYSTQGGGVSTSASTSHSTTASTQSTTNNPEIMDNTSSDLGETDLEVELAQNLVELGDESGGQLQVSLGPYDVKKFWFISPQEVPNKEVWEDGWWKVRLSTSSVTGDGIALAQVRIHRVTEGGTRISQDNEGWLEPFSWTLIGSTIAVFGGQVDWGVTDFTQAPDKKDRIVVEVRFVETGNDSVEATINVGAWSVSGVDKPISINTTTTSASTTRSSSVSTTRSTSKSSTKSTSRSTSKSSTKSTTKSTSQSSSKSTTRSSSVSTTKSTSRSTSKSSTKSTTRSSSASSTKSTTRSTSRSTSKSTSMSSTASTESTTGIAREVRDSNLSDVGATDTPADQVFTLPELGDESGSGSFQAYVAALGTTRVLWISPPEVPNKVVWEDGPWKVRVSVGAITGQPTLQVRVHRVTEDGTIINPDNMGWLAPYSFQPDPGSVPVFRGNVTQNVTDFSQEPNKKDRFAVEVRVVEVFDDPASVVFNLGTFAGAGVDKPVSVNTTTTSASTTKSTTRSTSRSSSQTDLTSASSSRSTSRTSTRSSSVSTTRSTSKSSTRSTSRSSSKSTTRSTTRSSSDSTTRSSSASTSRSTSRSTSVTSTASTESTTNNPELLHDVQSDIQTDAPVIGGGYSRELIDLGGESGGAFWWGDLVLGSPESNLAFAFSPPKHPWKVDWETGTWKVRVAFNGVNQSLSTDDEDWLANLDLTVRITRVDQYGISYVPSQEVVSSLVNGIELNTIYVFNFQGADFNFTDGAITDRIRISYGIGNLNPFAGGSIRQVAGVFSMAGVDKPVIPVTSNSTSASTSRSTTRSTTKSTSMSESASSASTSRSTSRSSSVSTTKSTTKSTTRSTSKSTTRTSSATTTKSTTKSTTRSSSVSTTRSTSVSTTKSTTRSSSVSTTRSTSMTKTASSASSSLTTTRSSSVSSTRSTSRSSSISTTKTSSLTSSISSTASTSASSSFTSSLTTTATVPPGTPGQGQPTTPPPPDPCLDEEADEGVPVALCLHVKFIPRYNDPHLIQHADDQISNGSEGAPICFPNRPELNSMWGDHERAMTPIGNSVESYQGFKTVEVFVADVIIGGATDGYEPLPGLPVGTESLFLAEANIETCKMIYMDPVPYPGFFRFRFRLRTISGSPEYVDAFQYVYVVGHDACGNGGAPTGGDPARCDDSPDDGDGGPGDPPNETTATSTTTTTTTTTTTSSSTTSATTSKTSTFTTSGTTTRSTTASTSASTSRTSSISSTGSTSASSSKTSSAVTSGSTSKSTTYTYVAPETSASTTASTSASTTVSSQTTTSASTSKTSSLSTTKSSSVSSTRSTSKTSSGTTTKSTSVSTTRSTSASTSKSTSATSTLTSSQRTTTTPPPPPYS